MRPRAVLFDLLTGLLDSWSLWDAVAGGVEPGRRWRQAYLRNTYGEGGYRDYETLVAEAAVETGLPADCAARLAADYGRLEPWPEAPEVLRRIRYHMPIAVVTNCSETLGRIAVARLGCPVDAIVTAERAGAYKPRPEPYRLALSELKVAPADTVFVAGSAFDIGGASAVGMRVFWHDRIGMAPPPGAREPAAHERRLEPLLAFVGATA